MWSFAITNTMALVLGDDPNKLFFDQAKMRQYQCLEKEFLLPFPVKRSRRALKKVVTVDSFDIYCTCRMPEMVEGEKWGECTKCLRWYHMDKCLNISQESLEGYWTVYLRNISSLSVSCTCLFVTCMSFMHTCTAYSCTITVCLIHSLTTIAMHCLICLHTAT